MTAVDGRRIPLETVRIVDDEASLKPVVRLQWQPIEQRDDRGTGRRLLG